MLSLFHNILIIIYPTDLGTLRCILPQPIIDGRTLRSVNDQKPYSTPPEKNRKREVQLVSLCGWWHEPQLINFGGFKVSDRSENWLSFFFWQATDDNFQLSRSQVKVQRSTMCHFLTNPRVQFICHLSGGANTAVRLKAVKWTPRKKMTWKGNNLLL